MKWDDRQTEPAESDERLEQALDRLGTLVAPESAAENAFVSRVMRRIHGATVESRRPNLVGRWLVRIAIGAAACLVVAAALWRTMADRPPPVAVANNNQEQRAAASSPPVEAAPVVRTSTWSTVSEDVVLERDVPVRKLFYREFERVELLDSRGNTESRLIVPTKAMLVASKEWY